MTIRTCLTMSHSTEPTVVRGTERSSLGRRQTVGESSDDTLDTSGEEDNKDTVSGGCGEEDRIR